MSRSSRTNLEFPSTRSPTATQPLIRRSWCRNGVDLNRAFPDRRNHTDLNLVATGGEPPEVRALMRLATTLPFVAGCNMHEGALVANYPWDGDAGARAACCAAWVGTLSIFQGHV